MENKIREKLIINNLYDEYNQLQIEKSNNPEIFLKTYHIDSEKEQKKIFMKNAPRDDKGFIILDNYPFIYSNKRESRKTNWLLFNNASRVLLKTDVTLNMIEQELLIMYFLKSLNISCANYEPVIYKGEKYLATPSFLGLDEKIIKPSFSYELDIELAYQESKKYHNDIHYLKTIFSDRIYGNSDRFPFNYGIITGGKIYNQNKLPKNCPLFDNAEHIFNPNGHKYFPRLENGSKDMGKIINYLLSFEEIMHWVIGPMKKTNLQDVANRLRKEKGFIVRDTTFNDFESYFKDSEKIINDELKNKGSNRRIKLT